MRLKVQEGKPTEEPPQEETPSILEETHKIRRAAVNDRRAIRSIPTRTKNHMSFPARDSSSRPIIIFTLDTMYHMIIKCLNI